MFVLVIFVGYFHETHDLETLGFQIHPWDPSDWGREPYAKLSFFSFSIQDQSGPRFFFEDSVNLEDWDA